MKEALYNRFYCWYCTSMKVWECWLDKPSNTAMRRCSKCGFQQEQGKVRANIKKGNN